jgi:hypothetical protein
VRIVAEDQLVRLGERAYTRGFGSELGHQDRAVRKTAGDAEDVTVMIVVGMIATAAHLHAL